MFDQLKVYVNKSSRLLSYATAPKKSVACDDQEKSAARYLLGSPNQSGSVVAGRSLIVFLEGACPLWDHTVWLDKHTLGVTAVASIEGLYNATAEQIQPLAIFSVDAYLDLAQALDVLFDFRERRPDVPLLISSRHFEAHVLTMERSAISDASLRLPASRAEIALCLGAALSNHSGLRARKPLDQVAEPELETTHYRNVS